MMLLQFILNPQVGPMVTMIYRMMMQDLARFGTVFTIFVMGFSQAFYIIFLSFKGDDDCDPQEDQECYVSERELQLRHKQRQGDDGHQFPFPG